MSRASRRLVVPSCDSRPVVKSLHLWKGEQHCCHGLLQDAQWTCPRATCPRRQPASCDGVPQGGRKTRDVLSAAHPASYRSRSSTSVTGPVLPRVIPELARARGQRMASGPVAGSTLLEGTLMPPGGAPQPPRAGGERGQACSSQFPGPTGTSQPHLLECFAGQASGADPMSVICCPSTNAGLAWKP